MRSGLPTLAGALERAGYETHMLMGNLNCLPIWGMGTEFCRGVDLSVENPRNNGDADEAVIDQTIETLRFSARAPWFVFVHLMSPHQPYNPPEPYRTRFTEHDFSENEVEAIRQLVKDIYDGEIAYVDMLLGRLFDTMKRAGLYEDCLIILVADHGEQFWEHGANAHGLTLYEEELRVPLIVKQPGRTGRGKVCETMVEMVDLAPTILELVGAPPEPRFQGRSFVDVLGGGTRTSSTPAFASLRMGRNVSRMARTESLKYVQDLRTAKEFWHDLRHDAGETQPLAEIPPEAQQLTDHMARMSLDGAQGLHVLITDGLATNRVIEGVVRGEDLGEVQLSHASYTGETTRDGGTLRFRVRMKLPDMSRPGMQFWQPTGAAENSAHLHIAVPGGTDVAVTLQADGKPIEPQHVRFGATGERRALDGTSFPLLEALAGPDAYVPAKLPQEFRAYVWYVADPEQLSDEELSPEVLNTLEALGYLE
jgi:hypothetical protein